MQKLELLHVQSQEIADKSTRFALGIHVSTIASIKRLVCSINSYS